MNLRPQDLADAQATAQADPDRERLARVRYTLCGCEVSYLVQGPIRVEIDNQAVEVHVDKRGLRVGAVPENRVLQQIVASLCVDAYKRACDAYQPNGFSTAATSIGQVDSRWSELDGYELRWPNGRELSTTEQLEVLWDEERERRTASRATDESAIHSAARAGTVAERERQIRALVGR